MAKRKMTEKQLANLQTDKYKFSKDNPEIAQKCQKLSVEKRKENQSLADLLKIELTLPDEDTGETNNIVMTKAILKKAKNGDVSAYQTIRDTIGEKPTQDINLNGGLEIQKVFIDEATKKSADKHIDKFIDEH